MTWARSSCPITQLEHLIGKRHDSVTLIFADRDGYDRGREDRLISAPSPSKPDWQFSLIRLCLTLVRIDAAKTATEPSLEGIRKRGSRKRTFSILLGNAVAQHLLIEGSSLKMQPLARRTGRSDVAGFWPDVPAVLLHRPCRRSISGSSRESAAWASSPSRR